MPLIELQTEYVSSKSKREVNMADEEKCPGCNKDIMIEAKHRYQIYRGESGAWCKSVGDVDYNCVACGYEFGVQQIADILTKVDEL